MALIKILLKLEWVELFKKIQSKNLISFTEKANEIHAIVLQLRLSKFFNYNFE